MPNLPQNISASGPGPGKGLGQVNNKCTSTKNIFRCHIDMYANKMTFLVDIMEFQVYFKRRSTALSWVFKVFKILLKTQPNDRYYPN